MKINVIGNECYLLLQKALLKIKTLKMSIIKDKNIEDEYNEDKNIPPRDEQPQPNFQLGVLARGGWKY